jgi:hypothetical protein
MYSPRFRLFPTEEQRVWMVRDTLPALKDWWPDLKQVYFTVLQKAIERIRDNIQNLGKLKSKGYNVGSLSWKRPREYRSFMYRQSGFELDKLGVVHSESTPVETATAVSTDGGSSAIVVDASRVVETGSPALKEAASAVSE